MQSSSQIDNKINKVGIGKKYKHLKNLRLGTDISGKAILYADLMGMELGTSTSPTRSMQIRKLM